MTFDHLNFKVLLLSKKNMVNEFNFITQLWYKSLGENSTLRAINLVQLVHVDICEPIKSFLYGKSN
ncbi:hypothetical protein CR513_52449, partial [Mucuna pruriens]